VEIYQNEDEQVEALKRWWNEYGRAVLAGLAIALVLAFGWRAWVSYRSGQSEKASAEYEQMLAAVQSGALEKADKIGRHVVGEFESTPYAPLASLYLAKIAVGRGELPAAEAHLRWALDNAKMPGVKNTARLRLARVLLAQNKPKEALALLEGAEAGGFEAAYAEAKGDIYAATGERAKALDAYQRALTGYVSQPTKQSLLKMKIDDLAGAAEAAK
jgi:predicted negative regulator of RcsB-dependent stress response